MFGKGNIAKSIIPIIMIVILVAAGLILTYVLSNNDTGTQIVLPTASPETETGPSAESQQSDMLLSVSPDNVRDVLSTVNRTASYHRTLSISLISGSSISSRSAEIWVRDGSYYYEITAGSSRQHVLVSEGIVNIWYDGDETPHSFDQSDYFSVDDLVGIPTYEDVLELEPELITAADYVTGSDGSSLLYVEFMSDNGEYEYRYWVSLETGLLSEAVSIYNGETVYSMKEIYMQQLPATDAEFDGRFVIPEA